MALHPIQQTLRQLADSEQAERLKRFFKTDPGQYGEGDQFLGIKVPEQRQIAKQFGDTPLNQLPEILHSPYHEERLTGFIIVLGHFQNADSPKRREEVIRFLLEHRAGLNNWDIVDVIVPGTIGEWILHQPVERKRILDWIHSDNLWERRMAMLASFTLIRAKDYVPTLLLCEHQLASKEPIHDLMQKASGWMLREIGKRDLGTLLQFLDRHAATLPRTMLRYALERLTDEQRQQYMQAKEQALTN